MVKVNGHVHGAGEKNGMCQGDPNGFASHARVNRVRKMPRVIGLFGVWESAKSNANDVWQSRLWQLNLDCGFHHHAFGACCRFP